MSTTKKTKRRAMGREGISGEQRPFIHREMTETGEKRRRLNAGIFVYVRPEFRWKLKEIAMKKRTNVSDMLRKVLEDFVEKNS